MTQLQRVHDQPHRRYDTRSEPESRANLLTLAIRLLADLVSENNVEGAETVLCFLGRLLFGVGEQAHVAGDDGFDAGGGMVGGEALDGGVEEADGDLVGGLSDVFVDEGSEIPVALAVGGLEDVD